MSVPARVTTVLSVTLPPTLARSSPASTPVSSVTFTRNHMFQIQLTKSITRSQNWPCIHGHGLAGGRPLQCMLLAPGVKAVEDQHLGQQGPSHIYGVSPGVQLQDGTAAHMKLCATLTCSALLPAVM